MKKTIHKHLLPLRKQKIKDLSILIDDIIIDPQKDLHFLVDLYICEINELDKCLKWLEKK